MPSADAGPFQLRPLSRGPAVFQVGCRSSKIHIELRRDANLQIGTVQPPVRQLGVNTESRQLSKTATVKKALIQNQYTPSSSWTWLSAAVFGAALYRHHPEISLQCPLLSGTPPQMQMDELMESGDAYDQLGSIGYVLLQKLVYCIHIETIQINTTHFPCY